MEILSKRFSALDPMRPSQVTQSAGDCHSKKGSQGRCSVTQEAQRMGHREVTAQLAPRHPLLPIHSASQQLGPGILGFEPNRLFLTASLLDGLQGSFEGLYPEFLSPDMFQFSLS